MARMRCPRCKSNSITLITNEANMKGQTSFNLNPLKPLTILNHKKVKKVSAGKVALGVLTAGLSLPVTGIKKSKNLEVFCQNCGHRWKTK